LLYVLPQSSLFIMAEVLFMELFFFRRVGRVYEVLIILAVMIVLTIGTYISFLMTNVFNVATIKEIPLIQAARTVSHVVTLLVLYFITSAVLDSGLNFVVIFLVPLVFYAASIFLHLKHMKIEGNKLVRYTLLSILLAYTLYVGVMLVSQRHELIALAPTVGGYVALELLVQKDRNMLNAYDFVQYIAMIIGVYLLNIFL